MTIIICCDDRESGNAISEQINRLCHAATVTIYNTTDFLLKINDNPDAVMMITQKGSLSPETAMLAREHNPTGKLIWFSDLDFSLISFRLKATYFGLLPLENNRLKTALEYCVA